MLLLPLFALLAFLSGAVILFAVLSVLRAVGAFGGGATSPQWLPPTVSGAFQTWGEARTVCAALRDPVYHGANFALIVVGTIGIALFSASLWVSLALAIAYLCATLVFFLRIYGVWACQSCYYIREAHTPLPKYRATEEWSFKLRYRSAVLAWYVLAWVWPMTLMAYGGWELGRTVEVYLFAAMAVFGAIVFAPVVGLRICAICRVNTLGMCPMPWKDLVMPERPHQTTGTQHG